VFSDLAIHLLDANLHYRWNLEMRMRRTKIDRPSEILRLVSNEVTGKKWSVEAAEARGSDFLMNRAALEFRMRLILDRPPDS